MKFVMLTACLVGVTTPVLAQSSMSRHQAMQQNRADARDVDDQMGRTIAAITAAESHDAISHRRADQLRNRVDRMRVDYSRSKRSQGFVSAGELTSYYRTLGQINREVQPR